MSIFQQWFSREGCFFDAKSTVVDVAVLCHEVRGIDASGDEQVFVSVRDARRGVSEDTTTLGTASQLKGISLEATLLLRVWAGRSGTLQGSRICGELLIPLTWLVTRSQGVLYQTWVALDASRKGMEESTESAAFDRESTFDRQVSGGESLEGPRVCLSVCRSSELGSSGRLLLAMDVSADVRSDRWCALLKSQKQHEVICTALHDRMLHSAGGDSREEERLRRLAQAQAEEMEELRCELRAGPASSPAASSSAPRSGEEPCDVPSANAARRIEIDKLKGELESLSHEANSKIDAANDRIRSLRRDRDEARGVVQQHRDEAASCERELSTMREDVAKLAAKKESLLAIVEDLHRTCSDAGLEALGRNSIDSITNKFRLD